MEILSYLIPAVQPDFPMAARPGCSRFLSFILPENVLYYYQEQFCYHKRRMNQSEQTDLLMRALLALETTEEAQRFLEDVLTVQELRSITQRLEVAVLLRQKVTYQKIAHQTGASTATISRVNRALQYGADGYRLVLDRLQNQSDTPMKQDEGSEK